MLCFMEWPGSREMFWKKEKPPVGGGGKGGRGEGTPVSSDRDDRMEAKIKTQKETGKKNHAEFPSYKNSRKH